MFKHGLVTTQFDWLMQSKTELEKNAENFAMKQLN